MIIRKGVSLEVVVLGLIVIDIGNCEVALCLTQRIVRWAECSLNSLYFSFFNLMSTFIRRANFGFRNYFLYDGKLLKMPLKARVRFSFDERSCLLWDGRLKNLIRKLLFFQLLLC